MDTIAEYPLHLKYPDGSSAQMTIRVDRPQQRPNGIWECNIVIDGGRWAHLQNGPFVAPSLSDNSWQALTNALRHILIMISTEVVFGASLYSADGKTPIHFDELFPFPRDGERPMPN